MRAAIVAVIGTLGALGAPPAAAGPGLAVTTAGQVHVLTGGGHRLWSGGLLTVAQPVWSANLHTAAAAMVLDTAGTAHVAWSRGDADQGYRLETRVRTAGGDWGHVQTVGHQVDTFRVLPAPDGNVVFAWVERLEDDMRVLRARTRFADGALGPIQTVSGSPCDFVSFDAAISVSSTATFAWNCRTGTHGHILTRRRYASGALGSFQFIAQPAGDDLLYGPPEVAVAPDGSATFAWTVYDRGGTPAYQPDDTRRLYARRREPSAALTTPQAVSPPDHVHVLYPDVLIDPNGRTVFTWLAGGLHVRTQSPEGEYGFVKDVSAHSGWYEMAAADSGAVTLVFQQGDDWTGYSHHTRTLGPAGTLSRTVLIGDSHESSSPAVAVSPSGTTAFGWLDPAGTPMLRVRSADGTLHAAQAP